MSTIAKLIDLSGRRALVTGAGGHIGRVIAETLAELGADLVLVDLEDAALRPLADELIRTWGHTVECITCDLEHEVARAGLITNVLDLDKRIDVLVNNAAFVGTSGLPGWTTSFEEQSVETWRRALEVNLTAAFDLCKGFTPSLRQSTSASIINIASMYGHYAPDYSLYKGINMGNPAAYAASKGGLIQLTRWLSTTLAPTVRANCISPGGVFRHQANEFVQRYESRTPLARMASEDDFRGSVAYLASDLSRYLTGQNLAVDGGWGVW